MPWLTGCEAAVLYRGLAPCQNQYEVVTGVSVAPVVSPYTPAGDVGRDATVTQRLPAVR